MDQRQDIDIDDDDGDDNAFGSIAADTVNDFDNEYPMRTHSIKCFRAICARSLV